MTPARPPFRLGVNYWPSRTAMSWWKSFLLPEVAADFARIADSGCDSVRIFLTWEDFQPEPARVDATHASQLSQTLDVAQAAGLSVMPTLFTGHMSGVNWIPRWALGDDMGDSRFRVVSGGRVVDSRLASWYSDPQVTRAQALLAAALARTLAGHPALWAWDLGNENSNCGAPASKRLGRDWLRRITDAIRGADGSAKITHGLHMEDLEHNRNLGPKEVAESCDFLTMHGYPGYAPWTAGATDERLLPFLARLTQRLGSDVELVFSEFGVPTAQAATQARAAANGPALVSEEAAASYVERGLKSLHHCGSSGAMLWCYADYATALFGQPPLDLALHERSFGLWRADASPKPSVAALRSLADRLATLPPPQPLAHSTWFDLDVDQFYLAPERELPRLFARYCAAQLAAV